MPTKNDRDPRTALTRDKYFSFRPKPLEKWLWQQGIPQAAERVFWMHWEEGMRRGDWCSELALKHVARDCAIDTSTVTRAYQALKRLGLVRREDPGRDPQNPFRQAIAITEVLLPRELLLNLSRFPNRAKSATLSESPTGAPGIPITQAAPPDKALSPDQTSPPDKASSMSRAESKALMAKLSDPERNEFFRASRDRKTAMRFDETTQLSPDERGRVLQLLTTISTTTPSAVRPAMIPPVTAHTAHAKPRQLSPLEAARVRASVLSLAPASEGTELFRQVLWSIEEGALRRFDPRMALNIALKKIREGAWTRPNRLPPNWLANARAETCSAA